eukprot:357833-Chlamydomonas_euryale.AAC.4
MPEAEEAQPMVLVRSAATALRTARRLHLCFLRYSFPPTHNAPFLTLQEEGTSWVAGPFF